MGRHNDIYCVSAAEQAGLNLTWSKIPEDSFSRDVAQLLYLSRNIGTCSLGFPLVLC